MNCNANANFSIPNKPSYCAFFAEEIKDPSFWCEIWMQKKRPDKNLIHAIWFDIESNSYFIGPKTAIEEIVSPFLKTSGTITCPHDAKLWSFWNGTEWVELQSNQIGM